MSWKAREWADRYAALTSDRNFRVLNALAGYASHDGTGIRVSQATVARRIGSTDRKVRRALAELEGRDPATGLVVCTPWIIRSGPGNRAANYRLNYGNLRPDPEVQNGDPKILTDLLDRADTTVHPDTTVRPDNIDQQGGQNCPAQVDNTVRLRWTELSTESVRESVTESVNESVGASDDQNRATPAADAAPHPRDDPKPPKRKKPRHPIADDWEPRPDVRDQMQTECPTVDQDTELLMFRDHFLAKAETSTDWNLNYRGWCRRQHGWNLTRSSGRGTSGNEKPRGMTPAEILAGIPGNTPNTTRQASCTQLPAFPTEMEIVR